MLKAKIIGCGLSGVTSAIILKERGYDVEIFDNRGHIAGNCYDTKENDVTVHKYGAHIFHTNDEEVWKFLNRYTSFNSYSHKVRANTDYGLISIPYNYLTRDQIGKDLSPEEIQKAIFVDYSERHWGIPWSDLPKSISSRLPNKREDYDDRYFTDKYQGIPSFGYTSMFSNMLDGNGIKVHLDVPKDFYKKILTDNNYDLLVYTGKPDDYFEYCHGELEYRSLKFEHTTAPKDGLFSWENGAVINECNKLPYNRTVDNSIFLNQDVNQTVYTRDYPEEHNSTNDPIYPKNFGTHNDKYSLYNRLMHQQNKTIFVGRLATYKYLDMWMAIKQVFQKLDYSI